MRWWWIPLVSFLLTLWGAWRMSEDQHLAKEKERSWQWKKEWEKDEEGEWLDDFTLRRVHIHYCLVCQQCRECEVEHRPTRRQPLGDGPYGLTCEGCAGKTRETHVCTYCEEEWLCIKAHRGWLWECTLCERCQVLKRS